MEQTFTDALKLLIGDRLKEHEPMSRHTNFRIGGPARWYVEAKTVDECVELVRLARSHDVRVVMHGGGSNVLYADGGVEALVLVPAFRGVKIDGTRVIAEAGAMSGIVARKTSEAGLAGLTWMISLPGTIGGAVRGNAGCFGGETKDDLTSIEVYKPTEDWRGDVSVDDLEFSYRHSKVKETDWVVLSATFELEKGNTEELKALLEKNVTSRTASQPTNVGSAGCLFKNYDVPADVDFDHLVRELEPPETMISSRRFGAGFIIDRLGLKGTKMGGAEVSAVHGNFLVNTGTATADDVLQLVSFIKTRARNELGIQLQEEIQWVGWISNIQCLMSNFQYQTPMNITSIKATNMELTPAIRAHVEEKLGYFDGLFGEGTVLSADVEVGKTTNHHQKGDVMRCEVNLCVEGEVMRVEKTEPDLYKAIDKVKDHLARMVVDHKEKKVAQHRGPRAGKE